MVEFALILVLVALVALAALTMLGNQVTLTFQDVEAALTNPGDPGGTTPYACPNGTVSVLHGHKYHCL